MERQYCFFLCFKVIALRHLGTDSGVVDVLSLFPYRHQAINAATSQVLPYSGMEHGGPDFGRPQFWADMAEGMESEPDENGQITIKTGTIMERGYTKMYKANTLDELLTLCGYDEATKKVALESIAHYNELCHAGVDSDYGKGRSP